MSSPTIVIFSLGYWCLFDLACCLFDLACPPVPCLIQIGCTNELKIYEVYMNLPYVPWWYFCFQFLIFSLIMNKETPMIKKLYMIVLWKYIHFAICRGSYLQLYYLQLYSTSWMFVHCYMWQKFSWEFFIITEVFFLLKTSE